MSKSFYWLVPCGVLFMACASPSLPVTNAAAGSKPAVVSRSGGSVEGHPIDVSVSLPRTLRPRTVVSTGLLNPRGLYSLQNRDLLLAEAGTGDPAAPMTGTLSRLSDTDGDGRFAGQGERVALLTEQPSKNLLDIVRRDEVFGLAGMDQAQDYLLVALAFFGGPTKLLEVRGDAVREWGVTHLNINDVAFDPVLQQWFGVSSGSNEVVRLLPGRGTERVLSIPPLAQGQDAVPGYVTFDPRSQRLLVSLFSGSVLGEEGGSGVELIPRAGAILLLDPEQPRLERVVTGLTAPTDLVVAADGVIYVLEFCDAFIDPVADRSALQGGPTHGGFRRFSGRLLRIDRSRGEVSVLAEKLDTPTNLAIAGTDLYIAQGMGTPGREIPGPSGATRLDGFVERLTL